MWGVVLDDLILVTGVEALSVVTHPEVPVLVVESWVFRLAVPLALETLMTRLVPVFAP